MDIIRTYEVYFVDERLSGYEIEKPYPASTWGYDSTFNFPGKSAHIVIVSNDWNVDRAIALDFASKVAFNRIRWINIDLTKVSQCRQTQPKK